MKKLLLILIILLVACSPSPEAIQQAIAETQAAAPTATITIPTETLTAIPPTSTPEPTASATKIPLSELNLDWLFDETRYMPTGYNRGQISHSAPGMFDDYPKPNLALDMRFEKDGGSAGGVVILLYDNPVWANTAYSKALASWSDDEYTDMASKDGTDYKYSLMEMDRPPLGLGEISQLSEGVILLCEKAIIHIRTISLDGRAITTYIFDYLAPELAPYVCAN